MATATTLSPLETEGMVLPVNTMEALLPQPEPSTSSSDLNSEPSDAFDSPSSPKETNETSEKMNGAAIDSPTSASSSSLEVAPSGSDASNNISPPDDSALPDSPDPTTADIAAEAAETAAEDEVDKDESEELKIPFEPGDHITRWEMLPIAWPIQVHGIVLEVHEDAVVLVDFGLAAVPEGKNHKKNRKRRGLFGRRQKQPEEAAAAEENKSSKVVDESENGEESTSSEANKDGSATEKEEEKKQEQHVKKAIENFQKGFKKERNRLNVQTLTTKKEISKWSKVNYDGGLFGFGNNKDGAGENNKGDNKNADTEDQSKSSNNNSKRLEKRESWWGNLMKNQEKKKAEREQREKEKNAENATSTGSPNSPNSNDTIDTSPKSVDSEPLKIVESADSSSTPTNVPGCGGIAACAESGTPWWCRISMQRGKRNNSSTDKNVTAAMLEASKSGDLVQEYKKQSEKKTWDHDGDDFLGELEKRQMRKSLLKQHSDYVASMPDGVGDGDGVAHVSPSASAADEKKMEQYVEETNVESNDRPKTTEITPTDESETAFEEEKKDEHDISSYESSSKDEAPQLSVITDGDLSQTEAPSFESLAATEASKSNISPAGSPSSNAESLESSESSSTTKCESNPSSPNNKNRKHESKADPPAVVLARTRWLLKHGEGILPPYHAFSSNSECIAVFCKTGYWSTLQADIFLHSTAIGNAKSTVVTTLAVAASVPMMAPVVGVVGLGAVVAPWFYLDKQKKAAKEAQQRLADQFWAQAEPEVIVACVKAWSNLEEHHEEALSSSLEASTPTSVGDNAAVVVEETLLDESAGAAGESSD